MVAVISLLALGGFISLIKHTFLMNPITINHMDDALVELQAQSHEIFKTDDLRSQLRFLGNFLRFFISFLILTYGDWVLYMASAVIFLFVP